MAVSLDRFCEFTYKFEELKSKAAFNIHKNIKKLKLEIFKLIQATQERMAGHFANVLEDC
jgi:hypothetical protein